MIKDYEILLITFFIFKRKISNLNNNILLVRLMRYNPSHSFIDLFQKILFNHKTSGLIRNFKLHKIAYIFHSYIQVKKNSGFKFLKNSVISTFLVCFVKQI